MKVELNRASSADLLRLISSFTSPLVGRMQYAQLRAVGSDLTLTLLAPEGRISLAMDGVADVDGVMQIPVSTVAGLMTKLPTEKVTLEGTEKEILVRAQRYRYKVPVPPEVSADPIDDVRVPENAKIIRMEAALFRDMMRFCAHAMTENDPRAMLNGITVSVVKGQLHVVASNGARLGYAGEVLGADYADIEQPPMILPSSTMRKFLPEMADVGTAEIGFAGNEFYISFDGGQRFMFLPLQARAMEFSHILSSDPGEVSVIVDAAELSDSIGRAALMYRASDVKVQRVTVDVEPGGTALRAYFEAANAGGREFDEEVTAECLAARSVTFNVGFLRDAVIALGGRISVSIPGNNGVQCFFRNPERAGRVAVVCGLT